MIEDYFGMYLVLIPIYMTEILAKECKSGKSTVLALGTVSQATLINLLSRLLTHVPLLVL